MLRVRYVVYRMYAGCWRVDRRVPSLTGTDRAFVQYEVYRTGTWADAYHHASVYAAHAR